MARVLIIVPFEDIYPPMNGGMQRCFNIINQLARHFDLTVIINQDKESFLKATNQYPVISNIAVYSARDESTADIFKVFPKKIQNALRYRWYKKTMKGPADGRFLQYYPVLVKLLKKNKYAVIILENLATVNAISIIRKYDKTVKIVFDAHNVDSNLAEVAVKKWEMKKDHLLFINKAESTLYKTVNAIFACSKKDMDDFVKMNHDHLPAVIIPNGVTITSDLFDTGVNQDIPEYILFCGSLASAPNSEGLVWFYNNIWPAVLRSYPNLKLLVVGSGKGPASLDKLITDATLYFTGNVDDVKPWYDKAAIAIVPLLTGSGTRLKILEAMGFGLPVVSTSKGAEGINYTHGKDIIIGDSEIDFTAGIAGLLHNKEHRLAIQQAARKLVKDQYDWDGIGNDMARFIKNKLLKTREEVGKDFRS